MLYELGLKNLLNLKWEISLNYPLPLQQGFGRLVRTKADRGVVAILDPRMKTKGYGAKIVRSLPPAKSSSNIADVKEFFARTEVG